MHGVTPATRSAPRDVSTLWIAWNAHRRTTGLCAAWDIPLHVEQSKLPGPLRWGELAIKTLQLLRISRPAILFVQNPSLVLTSLVVSCRPLFGYRLVVDAHNEGVRPFDRPYALVRWLTRRLLKTADVTIVTNDALQEDVLAAGGRPLTLPDSLPVIPESASMTARDSDTPSIAVIATFRADEPIAEIFAAAATMPDIRFSISGPSKRYRGSSGEIPPNVRLTGFLPDSEYWQLLAQATVVCDLTLKPDCIVCGAYEALAVGKPMVLSDNPATRELFGPAAILTGNGAGEIAAALRKAIDHRRRLASNARQLRETFQVRWQSQAAAVWGSIVGNPARETRTAV
jgi:glycosyltransferase involved in cell wall biosynthesis